MYEVTGRIGGKAVNSPTAMDVIDKYTDEPAANLHINTPEQIDEALTLASTAAKKAPVDPYERSQILQRAAQYISDASAELCEKMSIEAGFPISDARKEVIRAVDTLRLSATEALRFTGEMAPISSAPNTSRRLGFSIRKPVGVVAAVTPFNSPLNTVSHKVGPAIAAGNAVILKAASQTPSAAVTLAEALEKAGLPSPWLHVVNGPGSEVGGRVCADERVDFIAFTGSTGVGRILTAAAGLRRTQMELGAISCTVIDRDADISQAVIDGCVNASFRKAGQVCTSIQRLYVHADVLDDVTERILKSTSQLVVGNPKEEATQVGPLISRRDAERIESWINEATAQGAGLLAGGTREGTVIQPAVVAGVRPGMHLHDEEAFGPVMCIYSFDNDQELIDEINATPYGLAHGIFTRDINRAMNMAQELRVGTLYVNGTSSNRVDIMPYGGLKESGHGLEGPAYAAREMSEETFVSIEWSDPS